MSKIRLWKYMSNFEFLLDILENKRLYLANINKMNDPLEYYIPLRFSDTDVKNILDIKGVNYSFKKNMEYSLGSFPLNISDKRDILEGLKHKHESWAYEKSPLIIRIPIPMLNI